MMPRLLPYSPERDVYRLLGLPSSASADDIHAACRRLARTFHPDRNESRRATAEMQVVNVVRRVMTDPETRALYDRERQRFQEESVRPRPLPAQLRAWRPLEIERSPPSPLVRYLRAAALGLRAGLIGLAPPRCPGCRTVVTSEDVYCAACGSPRLTGGGAARRGRVT